MSIPGMMLPDLPFLDNSRNFAPINSRAMSSEELYSATIGRMAKIEIHPIHKAMMEECCERAISSNPTDTDLETLVLGVQSAFLLANATLNATLVGSLKEAHADQVTLNYRDQEFVFAANDPFLS